MVRSDHPFHPRRCSRFDREEIVRLINPEYTRITGVRPEVILGQPQRSVRPGAQLVDTLRD